MGISGLLPALAHHEQRHGSSRASIAGLRVAIDAYVWLHRGTGGCARQLCEGQPTDSHLRYVVDRVLALQATGGPAELWVVFDGGPLPAKAGEEAGRRAKRAANLAKARGLAAAGQHEEARKTYCQAVDVTPAMAAAVCQRLRGRPGITCLVAPYEADAQVRATPTTTPTTVAPTTLTPPYYSSSSPRSWRAWRAPGSSTPS